MGFLQPVQGCDYLIFNLALYANQFYILLALILIWLASFVHSLFTLVHTPERIQLTLSGVASAGMPAHLHSILLCTPARSNRHRIFIFHGRQAVIYLKKVSKECQNEQYIIQYIFTM